MKILISGLILFSVWCVISVRWYVCGIHELCDDKQVVSGVIEEVPPPTSEEVMVTTYQAPLAFEWSSADPITNKLFQEFRDSIQDVFDRSPAAVVEITGLYDPQELNNSEFENLGLARAENTKQLLLNSGIKRSIRIKSDTEDLSSGLRGKINHAILFGLVPQEVETTGFIITEATDKVIIHFPSKNGSIESNQKVQRALKKLAGTALSNNSKLLVVGHTDDKGGALENNKLGLRWAAEVKDMLISYGMPEKGVLAESEGEDAPLVSNATQRGRRHNRRVEIILI